MRGRLIIDHLKDEGAMRDKLCNQKGLSLVELIAAIAIIMLIIGPLLMMTFNLFSNSIEDGERNQTAYIAQAVMEEAKEIAKLGQVDYVPEKEYDGYNIVVNISDFSLNNDFGLKEIVVTVVKENSRFKSVTLKTVVRPT